jgi:acetylornithine/succinyldiaminopimelate/putrescine aminotransferase
MTATVTDSNTAPNSAELAQAESRFRAHLHARRLDELAADGLDVVVGRRHGARFEDLRSGRWLWNCHSNGGTFNLGHRNPEVIDALVAALDRVDIGNHHLLSPVRAEAAAALAATTGGALPGVVFSASGSEANEVAIKLARLHTGRARLVTTHGCYHGTTVLTIATNVQMAEQFGLDHGDIVSVPWNDVDAMVASIDDTTALVLLEAIPATVGFTMPDPNYLARVQQRCNETGTLLAIDEVQTGLGRTGEMWSHHHDGIVPDIVITGKGLSGGVYPIAGTLLTEVLFESYSRMPRIHVSTFGGAEVGCAVATRVCQITSRPEFLPRIRRQAEMFRYAFAGAPFELRQRGLVMAVRVPGDGRQRTWQRLLNAGVFGFPASFSSEWVQLKPPLVLDDVEAAEIAELVVAALQ